MVEEQPQDEGLVALLAQGTKRLYMGDSLWVAVESACRARFVPRCLALNAQVKGEDHLKINISPKKLKVNGFELGTPVGIKYGVELITSSNLKPEGVYSCSIDLVGAVIEEGREVLYQAATSPQPNH